MAQGASDSSGAKNGDAKKGGSLVNFLLVAGLGLAIIAVIGHEPRFAGIGVGLMAAGLLVNAWEWW